MGFALVTDVTPSLGSCVLFVLGWAAGWFLLARPARLPRAAHPQSARPLRPPLAVVVPARDEARTLPTLLGSVAPQLRTGDALLVVDDHSSDATAAVARAGGAVVLAAPELPDGWAGKPHACAHGVAMARSGGAEVLVFVDADVTLGPGVLEALAAQVAAHPRALVSVQPWHTPRSAGEQLSMLPNVVALMGCAAFSWLGPRAAARVAFGPVLACSFAAYDAAGGHAHPEVRRAILEDIALARRFEQRRLFVGRRGEAEFRMYDGLRSTVEGWTKGIGIGADATPAWAAVLTAGWVASLGGGWLTSPWFALASVAQLGVLARRAGRFSAVAVVLGPLAVVPFTWLVARSLLRRHARAATVSWKGRRLRPDQPTGSRPG